MGRNIILLFASIFQFYSLMLTLCVAAQKIGSRYAKKKSPFHRTNVCVADLSKLEPYCMRTTAALFLVHFKCEPLRQFGVYIYIYMCCCVRNSVYSHCVNFILRSLLKCRFVNSLGIQYCTSSSSSMGYLKSNVRLNECDGNEIADRFLWLELSCLRLFEGVHAY